jgi:hypothetical protein
LELGDALGELRALVFARGAARLERFCSAATTRLISGSDRRLDNSAGI